MPHLFEPFFTTREVGEGSGLGLSVSFAIVSDVGGTVEVQSAKGEGATFVVKLPVAKAEPCAVSERAAVRAADARRLRLLVIDDEPLVGRAVARHLREHDVTVEYRAPAALARLRRGEEFDAILTDMMMPEMSGIQFHEQLRRDLPELANRVIFMSGGAFGPEARAFTARMKSMVYEKPLDLPLLSTHLRRMAEGEDTEPVR
jgi:CheY-like chemotaxis protein